MARLPVSVPDEWLVAHRNNRPAFAGFLSKSEPTADGQWLNVSFTDATGLLERYRPAYDLGLGEHSDLWWKQLHFLYEPTDPRRFPSLASTLASEATQALAQYARTARDLADSSLISADLAVHVELEDETDEETILANLGARDVQAGFAVLLRQCDSISAGELATFNKVLPELRTAAESLPDVYLRQIAMRILDGWVRIMDDLHDRSLDQHLRDYLLTNHGAMVLKWREEMDPRKLVSTYNYGDLIHWGNKRHDVARVESDEYDAAWTRFQFLRAATGIAYAHIAFGRLVEAALREA